MKKLLPFLLLVIILAISSACKKDQVASGTAPGAATISPWKDSVMGATCNGAESFSQCPTYTPNGKYIVYMTGRDADTFPFSVEGVDWWIMNADGSNQRRLTYMNKKDNPQSVNQYRLAGTLSFLSDTIFLGGVMVNPLGLVGNTSKVNISQFVH